VTLSLSVEAGIVDSEVGERGEQLLAETAEGCRPTSVTSHPLTER
jgi:hypothetical protein